MAQTAKRKDEEGEETVGRNKSKKTRRSTSDVVEFLKEKISRVCTQERRNGLTKEGTRSQG